MGAAIGLLLSAGQGVCADKQQQPWAKIALDTLGYPGASQNMLSAGASVLTVNFLDSSHLLVTFGERGLVPRVAGDPVDHDDRMVAAEVVEVPSGKVLAKTEWHLHDHARYLWSLGQGRFLVRLGEAYSTMAPLANLKTPEPFRRVAFPYRAVRPEVVEISSDARIVTMEMVRQLPKSSVATWADAGSAQAEALIDLFRIEGTGAEDSPIEVKDLRAAKSPRLLSFPMNNDGYLWATEDERDPSKWSVAFNEFNGKSIDLGHIDSTCDPRLQLVSGREFLAFTCMGGDSKIKLSSYGFDAHETWEEPFDSTSSLAFAYAPPAGRFAMSRITTSSAEPGATLPVGETVHQEVRVYQTESGDLLLKVNCSPVFKTSENFDLSSDGRLAAVVKDTSIVLYQLPAPTKQDLKDMEEAQKFAPPSSGNLPINLSKVVMPAPKQGEVLAGGVPQMAAPVSTTQSASQAGGSLATGGKSGVEGQTASGDTQTARPKPTLLLPGEQPEYKDKKTPPQAPQ